MSIDNNDLISELNLLQISDSFFPTGLYSTSNGLEALFLQKKISPSSSKEELLQIIQVLINQQIGPCDCVVVSNTIEFSQNDDIKSLIEFDEIIHATKGIKEIRESSVRSGIQLLKTIIEVNPDNKILNDYLVRIQSGEAIGTYPISFGICCNVLGIKRESALLSFLYGFVVSMVGAALRLGIIQHFEGQKIIHQLKPTVVKVVNENQNKTISEIWQFSPQIEIYQMLHEEIDSKMFIT